MITMTSHDSMNTLLKQLDACVERERRLRSVIDELFIIICQHCTEEEIKNIKCLDDLQKLAKGE